MNGESGVFALEEGLMVNESSEGWNGLRGRRTIVCLCLQTGSTYRATNHVTCIVPSNVNPSPKQVPDLLAMLSCIYCADCCPLILQFCVLVLQIPARQLRHAPVTDLVVLK
jgi:hypothetical protein